MASKLNFISDLANQTAQTVTRNVDSWKRYLTTASRLYKYRFDEQLLIYAQRPEATACATMELWNNTMRRWVRPRSKGIALIQEKNGKLQLEHIFDVADTRPVRGAKMPYLWQMREDHHDAVEQALERRYGAVEGDDLGQRLMAFAKNAVNEVYRDHLRELAYDVGDSLLEELDDLNLEVRFRSLLTASVQFTLLTRCGLDPSDYLEDEDLAGIMEFSTPAVLHHLGNAASSLSKEMLVEIGSAIRRVERQKNSQNISQKPLAKQPMTGYTKDAREFSTLKRESEERSVQNGTDLQDGGRLPDPRLGPGRAGGDGGAAPGQVWDAAADLSEGASQRDLHLHAPDRTAGTPSAGNRPAGPGAGGQDRGRTEETEGRDRGTEGQGPDGMGADGEQLHRSGRGDGAGGDRLPVNTEQQDAAGAEPAAFSLFPTVEEQVEAIAAAQGERQISLEKAPEQQVSDAVIGRALTSGGNSQHSIERIVAFFQKSPIGSAAASFLEKEYGVGGKGLLIGGKEYAVWFDHDGFRIAPGRSAHGPGSTLVPWVNAAAKVATLLRDGMYAARSKLDTARDNEFRELSESLWYLHHDFSEEAGKQDLLPTVADAYRGNGFPESTLQIAELLKDLPTRQAILRELAAFTEAYEKDSSLLRLRPTNPPKELLKQVDALFVPPTAFSAAPDFAPTTGNFITEDEIDRLLCRGSGVSEGKLRIYSYFVQGHNAKECVDFLKEEYGIGGYSYTGYDEWHDSKGVKFSRSDAFSAPKHYDTVRLNWNQVQKRLRDLIDSRRYLNERERSYLPEYEKRRLARSVYAFYHYKPDPDRAAPHEWKFDANEAQIRTMLDDPAQVDALFQRMLNEFTPLSQDTPHYDTLRSAIRDIAMYQRGESPYFSPLPEKTLQAERQIRQEKKASEAKAAAPKANEAEAPSGSLAAAARALASKQRAKVQETEDGQLTLADLFAQPAAADAPAEPAPAAGETQREEPPAVQYDLGYGYMGNGLTVWNRLEEEHGDYKAIAHIDPDRTVTFYENTLPEDVKEKIRQIAATSEMTISATQDAPVFSTPPQMPVREPNPPATSHAEQEAWANRYRLLSRLRDDCDYFLDAGGRQEKHLWAGSVAAQISKMRELYDSLPEKPEWLTDKDIDRYEQQMADSAQEVSPAAAEQPAPVNGTSLYREALDMLNEAVRSSSFYDYLRDTQTDYDSAKDELAAEIFRYMGDIADSRPDIAGAYWNLPLFSEWLTEDVLEQNYQDVALDRRNLVERHRDNPEAPKWVREEPAPERSKAASHAGAGIPPAVQGPAGPAGAGAVEQGEPPQPAPPEPDLTPNVEEYLNLKAQHPDKLVGVQVGHYILFYGKDAETAAPALGTKLPVRDISGLGTTPVTGSPLAWQAVLKKLLEHGHSVVLARPDPEYGPDAPYEVVTERDGAEYIPLGMELTIDGRRMKIDSVDYASGTVSLQDMEMQGWYPIFRTEPVPFVRTFVEDALDRAMEAGEDLPQPEPAAPAPPSEPVEIDGGQITPRQTVTSKVVAQYNAGAFDIVVQELHIGPERHNFHITDDALGTGGQKTKYQSNVAAIRTLKQIEAESRLATSEEQKTLSRYVGWGGIAQAFDPNNEKWAKEYAELKELLTPEEYESARSTVLNAHYTSPLVIKAIYEAVARMGFQPGNVLEPSCGIGNFFGLLPESLSNAKLYGVELDSLTGRIAKQLYQKADITVDGFENTDYPDDVFDLAVGNVPFGEYKVHDKRYDRQNLLIHDYFITKTLDKVRPGGIVAFITSKGTMDKQNSKVREALAQKADLLGAIRLPNNAFKANAGTEVTTDILFFQKRAGAPEKLPEWVQVGRTGDGVPLNSYYLRHPEMVLGKMAFWENMYGNETETACLPIEGADLAQQLSEAIPHIASPDRELLALEAAEQEQNDSIPADPAVRNFSFALVKGKLYYRENSRMRPVELGKTPTERVKGMIAIRDSARDLIDLQLNGVGDAEIAAEQANLNRLYDQFTKKYGLLNSPGNRLAMNQDASYPLLCSLEILDDEGQLKRKADMFTKHTIQHRQPVTSVDTAAEALAVSIGERACVDLGFMASLMGGGDKIPQIVEDLKGVIFKDPATGPFDMDGSDWYKGWQTADEYLSGDVRKKLEKARAAAEKYPEFAVNVAALEQVQPKDLTAAEIDVRVGVDWIDPKYYTQFLFELLQVPEHLRQGKIGVYYNKLTGEWYIKGKSEDRRDNARIHSTYGSKRRSAYELFEDALNQRDTRIFDTGYKDGKEVRVFNAKETTIAQQKQEAICQAFRDWIFRDPERRAEVCATYNRLFNSIRPREYNGEHILFSGMNPKIKLEPHQRNAVARMLYGGNTLLAHCVGAGKTFEMTAAAMEGKRLGLHQKSLFVVPNHLTEQWGGDFLTLYPGAKVLVATKKDFEPKNRKKFCARIATGDYDAVIIGHSQFEKIPLSPERQKRAIEDQLDEVMAAIEMAKQEKAENFTIKQMERTRKNLEAKLKRLHDKKKDDTVTFEELGVDRLFVDEAHYYKNLYLFTKMRNVAGISQTEAQKSSDMFAKCRYLDEITGNRGVTFATGTPVSNSMVELYTMMRYLQYEMLEERGLTHFDSWATTFGEKVTAVELKPEGTGFRAKTRFARFYNLPELINLWKEAADIQTADMLNLPVPESEYITITTEPSEIQKAMVKELGERAEVVRKGDIDPSRDNMLKITSDGRKLALDQRLMNPLLPDDPNSKVNACVNNVFNIWQESAETRGTQLVFSDLSTPKGKSAEPDKDGGEEPEDAEGTQMEASIYEDIRKKLIAKGVPVEEIAFIHDANTEAQKDALFAKVRAGQVRILLGSTQKMGAGTNVQNKLVASHDLDCPWRPADLEQRAGRIVRRGNENEKVRIYRYVTKGTFDAYNWALVENKQKFIGQIMTSKSPARSIEDVDATALSYAEVKMLATGDPRIKEKMDLDIQVAKLKLLKSNHLATKYELEDKVIKFFPAKMAEARMFIRALTEDDAIRQSHSVKEDAFSMTIQGQTYAERKAAGEAIIAACQEITDPEKPIDLGEYRGFPMQLKFQNGRFLVGLKQNLTYTAEVSDDPVGSIQRINNALERIPESLEGQKRALETLENDLVNAKEEAGRPFPQEQELEKKSARLSQLNIELDNAEKGQSADQTAPAQEDAKGQDTPAEKPSIRKALRQFEAPAPAAAGAERSHWREAAR